MDIRQTNHLTSQKTFPKPRACGPCLKGGNSHGYEGSEDQEFGVGEHRPRREAERRVRDRWRPVHRPRAGSGHDPGAAGDVGDRRPRAEYRG